MALGQQAARRIGDDPTAISVVAVVDEFLRAAFRAQTERLIGDQFVLGEAVVHLDDIDVARRDAGGFVDLCRSGLAHVVADELHHVARREGRGRIGRHGLRGDAHVGPQAVAAGELFRHQNGGRAAAGRRAGHQARHDARPDRRVVEHVVGRHLLAEDRERIARRMAAGLGADLGEGGQRRAVLLHVAEARAAEQAQGHRNAGRIDEIVREAVEQFHRPRTVVEHGSERAGLHLLEAEGDHAVRDATLDRLPREKQRRRTRGAVVVDVHHRDAGHADLVERPLAAGGVAVHVSDISLLDLREIHAGVFQRQTRRAGPHHMIRLARSRLRERDHSDTSDMNRTGHDCLLRRKPEGLNRLDF